MIRYLSIGVRVGALVAAFLVLSLAALPTRAQVTYDGRDANAPWRATADAQIDAIRKADFDLQIKLPGGVAVSGAQVQMQMQRHEFNFGSALDHRYYVDTQSLFDQTYADKVVELFNTATPENALKWRAWAGNFGSGLAPAATQEGLDWLNARDIDVRGHAMMWPRYDSVPNTVRAILDITNPTQQDLQNLYDATFNHINDIGPAVAGKVYAWDMLNEPRTSDDVENALIGFTPAGEPTISGEADLRARWFAAAQAADPNATMFVNDFQIIPGGGLADNEPQRLKNQIDPMVAQGAVIDGLGFQSHFDDNVGTGNKLPTGIQAVWDVLDDFQSTYNIPIHITEYDFNTTDQQLQADYMRDFMTAVFAHDAIEAFVMWGFWEGKIANADSALFDQNWNIKPNGQAYMDLVLGDWWTDELAASDGLGQVDVRGFKGDYKIVVAHNGETYTFDNLALTTGGLSTTLVLSTPDGAASTVFLGGDVLVSTDWDNGTPSPVNPGGISVSGIAGDQVQNMVIYQDAGSIDFTHAQAFKSSLENTIWHLNGGTLTDQNSGIRVNDSQLLIAGGDVLLGSANNINMGKGTSLVEITAGTIVAKDIQFGTIGAGATPGSKVLRFGLGDGVVTLTDANPFKFGDDGDITNDFIDFVTGSLGQLITPADLAYFQGLWDDGNLRVGGMTGTQLGVGVFTGLFDLFDNGNGTTTLSLTQVAALQGDLDGDGFVGITDLNIVLGNWNQSIPPGNMAADPSGDGFVGIEDLNLVLGNWNAGSPPATVVPEPGTTLLFAFSGIALLRRRAASIYSR